MDRPAAGRCNGKNVRQIRKECESAVRLRQYRIIQQEQILRISQMYFVYLKEK